MLNLYHRALLTRELMEWKDRVTNNYLLGYCENVTDKTLNDNLK